MAKVVCRSEQRFLREFGRISKKWGKDSVTVYPTDHTWEIHFPDDVLDPTSSYMRRFANAR